ILGKKLGMTTIYDSAKEALNVTLIECPLNKVTLLRTKEKDNYEAVQVEIQKTKNKIFKKEFRVDDPQVKAGDAIGVDVFSVGDVAKVSGTSKAKGFQGVVKRHGFKGAPKSHGHKHDLRAPGSIGSGFPEHVTKGKRMAGRMGGTRSTSRNVEIVYIDKAKNLIGLKGPVAGIPGAIIEIFVK
ncbi:MAG: 50S ribosomal protein L3, partial [Candidatus Moranbacteria bacterium RBG_19FT_COMBO_42_6]